MPLYDFECAACATRFESLEPAGTEATACPSCGEREARRVFSSFAPTPKLVKTPGATRRQNAKNERLRATTKASFKAARRRARERRGRAGA